MDEVETDIVSSLRWVLTKCNSIAAVDGGNTSRAMYILRPPSSTQINVGAIEKVGGT